MNQASNQYAHEFKAQMAHYLIDGLIEPDDSGMLQRLGTARRASLKGPVIYYEDSPGVHASGGQETMQAIRDWGQSEGVALEFIRTGSLGFLSASPVIGIHLPGRNRLFFRNVKDYQVNHLLRAVFKQQVPEEDLLGQWKDDLRQEWEGVPFLTDHLFFKGQERRTLRLNGIIDPENILEYIAWGGYHAFAKCINYYRQEDFIKMIEDASVLGRSGSAFPAHLKWRKALSTTAQKRMVICNADESDPGGYMHRVLMEGNPHLILEGTMLAAYAVGASEAIIHTRSRYGTVVKRMALAIEQARKLGLIGPDITGSGFSLDVQLRRGPGAYVTGEETALISSLEGKRGMPRTKPPYPAERGLNGYPTVVHNVETIAQFPLIADKGANWYKSLGTRSASGTKLFSLSGKFENKGVLELPFGYSLETVINQNGGGVANGHDPKAVFIGGPAGKFVPVQDFDIRMDHEEMGAKELDMGSGSLLLLDEHSCPVDLVHHLIHFIQKESCGKCIPCREGTRRMAEILDMIIHKPDPPTKHEDLLRFKGVTELASLASVISQTSLCGLGKGAANPLISALHYFRDEFEEHVYDRICRAGVCQDLRAYKIDSEACTGCYVCFSRCPEQAIIGSPRQVHVILEDKCTGCGICYEVCKFNAVYIK